MAESIQRILKRRGLEGSQPETPEQIIQWLELRAETKNRPLLYGAESAEKGDTDYVRKAGKDECGLWEVVPMLSVFSKVKSRLLPKD